MTVPVVSVCIVSYNQENFIGQCLQSIVDQQIEFPIEILVGDDCSTDRTREILLEYAKRYSYIKVFLHKKNIGPWENLLYVHKRAAGKYVSHLDGDDYALPGKLEAQYAFMEKHPDCNLVWHRMMSLSPNGVLKEDRIDADRFPDKITADMIASLITVGANSSKFYRNGSLNFEMPKFPVLDYLANIEQVKNSYGAFTNNNIYGVYRLGIGIATTSDFTKITLGKTFLYLASKYPKKKAFINSACLMLMLVDLKNFRFTFFMYFGVWVRTFHVKCFFHFLKNYKLIKMLSY
ncbi:glycosyltransferase family 2 protein [Pedobacter sp. JCM 36344]|uniref:glycosyltransferase family 2 protein n=1 Tax=Pedobacter sp. JCM 36344 TaxID=3374280 RepID=UPI00397AF99A